MKKIIIILLILSKVVISFAQVNTKSYDKNKAFEIYPKFKISQKKSPVLKMPKFDIAAMLEEDEAVKGMDVPFRFGKGFDVNYTLKDGYWEITKNEAIDTSTEWDLEIYDQMQILKTKKVKLKGNQYKINTSGWQGGMYFVHIKFKDEILSGKFLVNR